MLQRLRNLFSLTGNTQIHPKYHWPFFTDTRVQQQVAHEGYAVCKLLNAEDIKLLKTAFAEIQAHSEHGIGTFFWNSGRSQNIQIRNLAKQAIEKTLKPKLQAFFLPGKADLMGGVFVAKPLGPESGLNPHQDSSHVEEDKFMSVYAWCTLTDVTVENGALHVIPGSHRFGNRQRSLNIPWQFAPYTELLWKYAKPIPMKAGEVLFFDSASIHCSSPNLGKELRLATNFFVKPSDATFLHYYQDAQTPTGMVEKFKVDMDFYYDKDFMSRPEACYPLQGTEPYIDLKLTEKKLARWCKAG